MRKGGGGRPLNSVVRKHFGMTGEVHEASRGSTIGAIFGAALIVIALLTALPVAVNFPESWPGAVLGLTVAGIGVALVAAHIGRARQAQRANQERRNAF
jgi:xanthine/uracil permease